MSSSSPMDEKEVAELLAQASKKHVSEHVSNTLLSRLPKAAETQSLTCLGKLLDAGARIFAYKVDQTYADTLNTLRDITKLDRERRKLEKLDKAKSVEPETSKKPAFFEGNREYEVKDTDGFQRVSNEDEHTFEEFPSLESKDMGDIDLPDRESYSKRPAAFPGAPNSDDDAEVVKERHKKIRKKCAKIAKNPNADVPLSDSSDEETTMQQRDAKLYDHFECVKFRNHVLHDNTRKFLLPEDEFNVELNDNEPYNPLYSKTVRRTGVTAGALMLVNTAMSESGVIMRLHPRSFARSQLKPLALPSSEEVRAHEDILGVMQKCLNPNKQHFRKLIKEVSKKGIQEAVKRRKSQKFVPPTQTQLTTQQKIDFTMSAADDKRIEFFDELIDPEMFIETVETKGRKAGKKGKPDAKRKIPVLLPTASIQKPKPYKVRSEPGKLDRQWFEDDELKKIRSNVNWGLLCLLSEKDAKSLGISSGLLKRLQDAAMQKSISDQLVAEVGSLVREEQKNALLELVFGDILDDAEGVSSLPEVVPSGIKFNFTDDFADFDSMWHCQVAKAPEKGSSQCQERRKSDKFSYVLARGSTQTPLYFGHDLETGQQHQHSWEVPRELSLQPLNVAHIPHVSELPMRLQSFEEHGTDPKPLGKSFALIEQALGTRKPVVNPNSYWVASTGASVIKLPKHDVEEKAQVGPFKRYGGPIVQEGSEDPNKFPSPPKRARGESVSSIGSDLLQDLCDDANCEPVVDDQMDGEELAPAPNQEENIQPEIEENFNETRLGDLQVLDDPEGMLNASAFLVDDSHWKAALDEVGRTPKNRGRSRNSSRGEEASEDEFPYELSPEQKFFFNNLLSESSQPSGADLPKAYTFADLFRKYSISSAGGGALSTPKTRQLLKTPRTRTRSRSQTPNRNPTRTLRDILEGSLHNRYDEDAMEEDPVGIGFPAPSREGSVAPDDVAQDYAMDDHVLEGPDASEGTFDLPTHEVPDDRQDSPFDDQRREELTYDTTVNQSQASSENEEMYRVQYKQSRVNAPLVKRAIATVLTDPGRSGEHIDVEEAAGVLKGLLIGSEAKIPESLETEEGYKAMVTRMADFAVAGHHTFTDLLARLPSMVDKNTADDLKPSTALTILLHMCNENVLELSQERYDTGVVSEKALHDFVVRSSKQ
uniref:Condensin complex subunit 2 n=1 Tax=Steinernema glaseri TaxID=37863 RepID=A0A1I7YGU1_9BILA